MKNTVNILTICLLAGATIFAAACEQQQTTTNANTAALANQAVAVNSNAANANTAAAMNHNGMNHGSMNHSEMTSSPGAASQPFDLQFLDTMTAHHQGAIEMAQMAVQKTQNAELKTFAEKIIDDQKKEIAEMKEWREKWYAGKPAAINMEMPGMKDSMKMMTDGEMKKMQAATGKEFDLMFLDMMIPHHKGAVVMGRDALSKAEHAEIKTLAGMIIRAQDKEIAQMNEWKAKWSK
jgi:uncharacterized protein (DUF305 family)